MVKTVLGRILSRGRSFQLFPGSDQPDQAIIMKKMWILFCRIPIEISMLIKYHFPAKRWDRLGEFKLLFWQPEMAMQPSFIILVQKQGQFSLRWVGLPCDTLLLVFITTCLIVKLLGGKHRVRCFSFNSSISVSDTSAPKPPKCPPNFMWRAREWSYSV